MIEVIKIKKVFRSGIKILYLVLSSNEYSYTEDLEDLIENKCNEDPSGYNYGYSYTYEFIKKDSEEYEKAISNEIIFYENKIKRYNEIINKLKNEK